MERNDSPGDPTAPDEDDPASRVLCFECEDDTLVIYDQENSTEWIKSSEAVNLRRRR